MLVLSLAACGKQDTDDGVKKFYNSMNDTTEAVGESTQSGLKAAAEENGKSVKKSSDILIVSDINSANETIRVYNYSTGVQYQYYYGLTTGFFDKYGNHMSVSTYIRVMWLTYQGQIQTARQSGYKNPIRCGQTTQ